MLTVVNYDIYLKHYDLWFFCEIAFWQHNQNLTDSKLAWKTKLHNQLGNSIAFGQSV